MAVNDFNLIAPFYDRLSSLVFGESLIKAQTYHLKEIGDKDRVLILGGGTGEILERMPPSGQIHFIEKSGEMLRRAKKRRTNERAHFIHEDFLNIELDKKYDVIICPFFLDCFSEHNLNMIIAKIRDRLYDDGILIVTDFDKKSIHSFLLQSMLIFFKRVSNLETSQLLDLRSFLKENDSQEKEIQIYKKGIFSALYSPVSKRKL